VSEDIPQIGVRNCGTPNIEEFPAESEGIPYKSVRDCVGFQLFADRWS